MLALKPSRSFLVILPFLSDLAQPSNVVNKISLLYQRSSSTCTKSCKANHSLNIKRSLGEGDDYSWLNLQYFDIEWMLGVVTEKNITGQRFPVAGRSSEPACDGGWFRKALYSSIIWNWMCGLSLSDGFTEEERWSQLRSSIDLTIWQKIDQCGEAMIRVDYSRLIHNTECLEISLESHLVTNHSVLPVEKYNLLRYEYFSNDGRVSEKKKLRWV